jgi:hypothetical protein
VIGNVAAPTHTVGPLQRALILAHQDSPLRVNADRTRAALELLDVLSDDTPAPELTVAIDGELTVYWQRGDNTLAIIPQVNGWLKVGAHYGREFREEVIPFFYPQLPDVVRQLLMVFVRCDA